jgi:hypothetical protein
MANCKDCLHVEVCKDYGEVFSLIKGGKCSLFKDRSRFVELPCKDGEYVYVIEPLCDSIAFHTIKRRKIKHIKPQARIQFAGGGWILDFLSAFNQYVFRTYEEAEQALKERIENDA